MLIACCVLVAACGSQMTAEEFEEILTILSRPGMREQKVVAAPQNTTGGTTTTTTGTTAPADLPTVGPVDTPTTTTGTDTGTTGDATATTGAAATTTDTSGTTGFLDTRLAPPEGNGGATDIGVTDTKIVVANIADITGAVPGLFEDAQLAVKAYLQFFAQTEQTVYGRAIEYLPLDSKLDNSTGKIVAQQACDSSFALVGSMSAFEQASATPIDACDIPDLRTAVVARNLTGVDNVFSADAMGVDMVPVNVYEYWKGQFPDAVTRSAYYWITAETTEYQTSIVRNATETIGYKWVVEQPIELAETNYAPFVFDMIDQNVGFLTFQGAYQQAVRLAQAMRQQGFWPELYALQSNIYTPGFLQLGGADVEGAQLAIPSVLLEEIQHHPELQLYATWVNQVKPGAQPTGLGMYAWAAAKLFIQKIKEMGPEVTRKKLIEAYSKVHDYTADGLVPPQNIGGRVPTGCEVVVEVRGGRFVRIHPPNRGFACSDKIVVAPPD